MVRARLDHVDCFEALARPIRAMHSARVATTHSIHGQALHPARFLQSQTERSAPTSGDQLRQAPSQALGVDAERVAYAVKRQRARGALGEEPVPRLVERV